MNRSVHWLWWAAVVVVAALPWLISATLLQRSSATWADLTPFSGFSTYAHLTDELFYWHQAASFRVAGLEAGYYTVNEQPAAASWTPYYAWGPFVPAFYGTLARVFGWQPHSMVVYNLALLSIGLIVFTALVRPPLHGLVLLGAIIATYSSLLIFHTVSMLPVMEMGLGLAGAGLIYWHFQRPRIATLVIVTILLTLFALIRGTWALVLLPLFLMTTWPANNHQTLVYLAAGLGLNLAIWGVIFATAAPYPDRLSSITRVMSQDVLTGLELWVRSSLYNARNINVGFEAAITLRWVGLGLIVGLVIELLRLRANPHLANSPQISYVRTGFVCIITLLMLFALVIFAYDVADWRDFRLLSPFVLMTVALMIAFRRWHWALIVLAVMIVGHFAGAHGHEKFIRAKADPTLSTAHSDWQEQLASVIVYDPNAESRWCNSLLFSVSSFSIPEHVIIIGAVPAGIGLNFSFDLSALPTVRSRWVILNETKQLTSVRLHPVLELPSGALYRNLDSPCETTQPPEASPSG